MLLTLSQRNRLPSIERPQVLAMATMINADSTSILKQLLLAVQHYLYQTQQADYLLLGGLKGSDYQRCIQQLASFSLSMNMYLLQKNQTQISS